MLHIAGSSEFYSKCISDLTASVTETLPMGQV
jgi:hypothetical protein